MRTFILLAITLSSSALAQNEAADAAADAKLRALTAAAPALALRPAELALSPALALDQVTAVAAGADGTLYILQRGKAADPIVVTDPRGNVLRTFGRGLYNRPHGIRLDPDGNVWTVDSNTSMVYKFSPDGERLLTVSVGNLWANPPSESCAASDIAFGADGHFYVADGYCNARIVRYTADGAKAGEWGTPGTGPGQFNLPHSIAVSPEGHVYVADRENGRIQWFTQDGEYLGEWHYGGRVLSVTFAADGAMFISAEPKGAEPQREATLLKIDRRDGSILGRVETFGHELSVAPDGSLLPASLGPSVTVFQTRR